MTKVRRNKLIFLEQLVSKVFAISICPIRDSFLARQRKFRRSDTKGYSKRTLEASSSKKGLNSGVKFLAFYSFIRANTDALASRVKIN